MNQENKLSNEELLNVSGGQIAGSEMIRCKNALCGKKSNTDDILVSVEKLSCGELKYTFKCPFCNHTWEEHVQK